jgi:hypothetical protein
MVAAGRNGELRHGRILQLRLADLIPAKLNDKVYRPVDENDPEIVALAESIREHGVKEPFVVTLDNVIISGNRRRVACRLAGVEVVPGRRENFDSDDPEFPALLVEYNRQRVKSLDERIREEVAVADPEEAYREVMAHRRKNSRVQSDTITIVGVKRRAAISDAKRPFLDAILNVLRERVDFWPLSDRSIHYALLNHLPLIHASKPGSRYANDLKSYKACCELLTRARLAGLVPWNAIHDPTRPVTVWNVYREPGTFVRDQIDGFLKGGYRDLILSQPNHIEIVGEKNTVEGVIRPVAMEYCIPYTIGRGYSSIQPRKELADRFRAGGKDWLILLFLTDFDPEGEDIPHSFARSMRDDFGIERIKPVKVALTPTQVEELNLPPQMKAKEGGSRYQKFVDRHGDDVFELEAVPPARLQLILRGAIDNVIDVRALNREIDAEKADAAKFAAVRRSVHEMLKDVRI